MSNDEPIHFTIPYKDYLTHLLQPPLPGKEKYIPLSFIKKDGVDDDWHAANALKIYLNTEDMLTYCVVKYQNLDELKVYKYYTDHLTMKKVSKKEYVFKGRTLESKKKFKLTFMLLERGYVRVVWKQKGRIADILYIAPHHIIQLLDNDEIG
jgi:hypothetical protein